VTVTGTGPGTGRLGVIAERTEVHFQQGKTLMLRIDLLRECEDTPSACAEVCADGDCLEPWRGPPDPLPKSDVDAGGADASDQDAGAEDAGDAGGVTDAGDAGAPDAMIDAGPIDPCALPNVTCFNDAPSNFDPSILGAALASNGALNVMCADAVFDSTTLSYAGSCDRDLEAVEITQADGVRAVVIPVTAMTIESTGALRLVGDRPVIFAVFGDVTINGTLDASADKNVPGAGGNVSCTVGNGARGVSQAAMNDGSSGGGGGAFGSVGGSGGRADVGGRIPSPIASSLGPSVAGGAVEGDGTLVPLRGGCAGGAGGQKATNGLVFGGAGGGAVQVSAAGQMSVGGVITAGGGGGEKALLLEDGGGAGGSGGAIRLEAQTLVVASNAWISANGGGGGGGFDYDAVDANPGAGANAPPSNAAGGVGGPGDNLGGRGGNGAGATVAAQAGGNATLGNQFNGAYGAGGGGGGGGVGRIRLRDNTRASSACVVPGNFSPMPVVACGG